MKKTEFTTIKQYENWYLKKLEENKKQSESRLKEWNRGVASQLVALAVKQGIIIKKKNCERCWSKYRIEGHHPEYLKPLKVEWLCQKCHNKLHKANNLCQRQNKIL